MNGLLPWRVARVLCIALALCAPACGDSDPADPGAGPGASPSGGMGGTSGGGGNPGGGATESDASSVQAGGDASVSSPDAQIQTGLDGGMPIPVEPPKPVLDAAISGKPLGNAYEETEYNLERPEALKGAFATVLSLSSGDTRLFVNELRAGDAGAEILYGAATSVDGGYVWQPSAIQPLPSPVPRSFRIGVSPTDSKTFVSEPFTYELEARVALDATTGFRLYLQAEKTTWTATFSDDYENITTGALYGIVTRKLAEERPLKVGAIECAAICNDIFACTNGLSTLANLLDCNGAQLDSDVDGDGTNDSYRMIVSFKSRRIEPPVK